MNEEEEIAKIMKEVEDKLTEVIGRYEAQRFLGIFEDYNLPQKLVELGKKLGAMK